MNPLSEVEKAKCVVIATALKFNGWANYGPEVYRAIACQVVLTEFSDDELTKAVNVFAPRDYAPSAKLLCERLNQAASNAAAGVVPDDFGVAGGIPLAPYRQRLDSLPESIKVHLRESVHKPAFLDEMERRCPKAFIKKRSRELAPKAFRYWLGWEPMAMACLLAWEMQDGRITEEIISAELESEKTAAGEHGGKA